MVKDATWTHHEGLLTDGEGVCLLLLVPLAWEDSRERTDSAAAKTLA